MLHYTAVYSKQTVYFRFSCQGRRKHLAKKFATKPLPVVFSPSVQKVAY